MKLLLTGATGYAGRGIAGVLGAKHIVRGADVVPTEVTPCQELVVGDIADYETCLGLVQGVDAMVLCHMAPNPHGYVTPPMAMDVNVKGTANLYHAAAEAGVKRVVLISSCGVLPLKEPGDPELMTRDAVVGVGPYCEGHPRAGLYVLTKILQEQIARHYFHNGGIVTTVLRPAWVIYDEELVTKYGEKVVEYNAGYIDPRDIGAAVVAALHLPDATLEAFNIGQDDLQANIVPARERLGWRPDYLFSSLPRLSAT